MCAFGLGVRRDIPTLQTLVQAGKRKREKFLHAHKLFHPQMNQKRLAIFARADQFCGAAAVTVAKSAQAVALAKLLLTLDRRRDIAS